ncbi:MAG: hypothetical protein FWF92_09760 [Oscillospiraceae bacterium]|nr:hypothetical protein [Oscillospiraceae bacterium]
MYAKGLNSNVDLLNAVYQNSKMGVDSIDYIFSKIKNNHMKKDLAAQMAGYLHLINKVSSKFDDINSSPDDLFFLTGLPSLAYMKLKICIDNSESHIAEIMIENSTAGLIEAQRIFNRCKNLDGEISRIGCETIYFEQKNINKLRNYL